MSKRSEAATYTHGHHASVLRSHSWRTAENSAAYLLPHLKPTFTILDIGCGPGTITADLAKYVPQGKVVGLEKAAGVLDQARATAKEKGVANVEFVTGDANALAYPDNSFDIVHCHQVLQHVHDPVGVLREMRRVAKPGGVVAARESDYSGFLWYPESKGLDKWLETYMKVAKLNGGDLQAGRLLHVWAKAAGFAAADLQCSVTSWCYSTPAEVQWWGGLWAERTVASAYAASAVGHKAATKEELDETAAAWNAWTADKDAWFAVPSGEIIAHKK